MTQEADPLAVPARLSAAWRPSTLTLEELPPVFTGGWVGYTGYDTVRYVFPGADSGHELAHPNPYQKTIT